MIYVCYRNLLLCFYLLLKDSGNIILQSVWSYFIVYKSLSLFFPKPSTKGGQCQPGYYCPEGSSAMLKCTAGYYCNSSGLVTPTGLCRASYYCPLGSSSPTQVDCPVGSYCVEGSDVPAPCRNGTYSPVKKLASQGECTPCDGGHYCNGTGLSSVSGPCSSGEWIFCFRLWKTRKFAVLGWAFML